MNVWHNVMYKSWLRVTAQRKKYTQSLGYPAKAAWIIRILNSSRAERKFNMQNSAFF